jgi:hypothetical protein
LDWTWGVGIPRATLDARIGRDDECWCRKSRGGDSGSLTGENPAFIDGNETYLSLTSPDSGSTLLDTHESLITYCTHAFCDSLTPAHCKTPSLSSSCVSECCGLLVDHHSPVPRIRRTDRQRNSITATDSWIHRCLALRAPISNSNNTATRDRSLITTFSFCPAYSSSPKMSTLQLAVLATAFASTAFAQSWVLPVPGQEARFSEGDVVPLQWSTPYQYTNIQLFQGPQADGDFLYTPLGK